MTVIKLFKNMLQRHEKPKDEDMEKFNKCSDCEYGVKIKPWLIHCIAGANTISRNKKDKICNFKPKRFGKRSTNENTQSN
jgi:hypothetical protein